MLAEGGPHRRVRPFSTCTLESMPWRSRKTFSIAQDQAWSSGERRAVSHARAACQVQIGQLRTFGFGDGGAQLDQVREARPIGFEGHAIDGDQQRTIVPSARSHARKDVRRGGGPSSWRRARHRR
jgi:hypothetical protein